jgi:glutamine amidotransferase/cyclase
MTNPDASVTLLDYGAGNVLSVVNALKHLGYAVKIAQTPQDITDASVRS